MAERRMFAKSIVLSDAFLDMPMSARCLYFTLSMFADDDGFVGSPKAIMRECGASQDDLAILLTKRFVLGFSSGVIVIKHWRLNNYLQNDRKKPTTYVEELNSLGLDAKNAYVERESGSCIQNVYKMYTQVSSEENSVNKSNNNANAGNAVDEELLKTLLNECHAESLSTEYPHDLLLFALNLCSMQGERAQNERYLRAILNNWERMGITTAEQAKEHEWRRRA